MARSFWRRSVIQGYDAKGKFNICLYEKTSIGCINKNHGTDRWDLHPRGNGTLALVKTNPWYWRTQHPFPGLWPLIQSSLHIYGHVYHTRMYTVYMEKSFLSHSIYFTRASSTGGGIHELIHICVNYIMRRLYKEFLIDLIALCRERSRMYTHYIMFVCLGSPFPVWNNPYRRLMRSGYKALWP